MSHTKPLRGGDYIRNSKYLFVQIGLKRYLRVLVVIPVVSRSWVADLDP